MFFTAYVLCSSGLRIFNELKTEGQTIKNLAGKLKSTFTLILGRLTGL